MAHGDIPDLEDTNHSFSLQHVAMHTDMKTGL